MRSLPTLALCLGLLFGGPIYLPLVMADGSGFGTIPAATATPTATPHPATLILPNATLRQADGQIHVYGQVMSLQPGLIQAPRVRVQYFGPDGALIATNVANAEPAVLAIGEKACFHAFMPEPEGWDTLHLDSSAEYGGVQAPGLRVLWSERTTDPLGAMEIKGQFQNDGATRVMDVRAYATIMDGSQLVIDCAVGGPENSTVVPGQVVTFKIRFTPPDPAQVQLHLVTIHGVPETPP